MQLCNDAQDLAEWLADNQKGTYDKSKRRFPEAKVGYVFLSRQT